MDWLVISLIVLILIVLFYQSSGYSDTGKACIFDKECQSNKCIGRKCKG